MNQSTKWVIGVIVVVTIVAAGYFVSKGPSEPVSTEPIKIGVVAPLTGDAVSYGEPIRNAIELAAGEINATGGVNGRKLEMIYEDGKCSGKDATSAAQKIINIDKAKIIIGGVCSSETLAMAPLAEQNKIIILSPAASSPDITNVGDFIFRNNPSDSDSGRSTAEQMLVRYKKLAVISENTDYAQGALKVFVKTAEADGGQIVANESFTSEKDFRGILAKIKVAGPEALFVNPQTEAAGGTIIKQARELGMNIPLFGNVVAGASKSLEIAGVNAEGMIVIDAPGLSSENQKAVKFLENYRAKYGKPNLEFYMGAAYDSVYILADAIARVGTDTEKIKNYLYALKNYGGVIGTYGFDENGDLLGIKFTVKQVRDGKLVEVK